VDAGSPSVFDLSSSMQTDYAVELGRDDETLEMPWAAPDGSFRYYDLKREPQMLDHIEEAVRIGELREFLLAVNAQSSILESAKCDAWSTNEIHPEEEIFGEPRKFGSYVDLLFTSSAARFSFEDHESFLKSLTKLLQSGPEIPASAEFILRRCHYHEDTFVERRAPPPARRDGVRDGFYVTFYLFGFGEDEAKARAQWAMALSVVTNALAELSSSHM
jgi:hypothetical protein